MRINATQSGSKDLHIRKRVTAVNMELRKVTTMKVATVTIPGIRMAGVEVSVATMGLDPQDIPDTVVIIVATNRKMRRATAEWIEGVNILKPTGVP